RDGSGIAARDVPAPQGKGGISGHALQPLPALILRSRRRRRLEGRGRAILRDASLRDAPQDEVEEFSGGYFPGSAAAFSTGAQRAISSFTYLSNAAGVRSALPGIEPPRLLMRVFTPSSSSALSSAAASLATTSGGVPFGAKMPAPMVIIWS